MGAPSPFGFGRHGLLAWSLMLFGCASANTTLPHELHDWGARVPADGASSSGALEHLRLNQVQVKGTHNSYHVQSSWLPIPAWQYHRAALREQLEAQAVRAVELDVHFDRRHGTVRVMHVLDFDEESTCGTFAACLTILHEWSDDHPRHVPLFVQVEVKDEEFGDAVPWTAYADELDETIRATWPRSEVLTPDDVQGSHSTLREAVTTHGWPALSGLGGKVVFFVDDRKEFHDAYTRGGSDCRGRMMFPQSKPDEPIAGFVIENRPSPKIRDMVSRGFIVRTMADTFPAPGDVEGRRLAALESGAQILSTDYPVDAPDVRAFALPDDAVFRVNPISGHRGRALSF